MAHKLYPALMCVLALVGTAAHALGLGGLSQLSALDQPFVGEIELIGASPDDLDSVKAQIASQAEFTRVGSERYHYLTKLRFSPQLSARGHPVIRVTSREPIREPYMDFLVEVVWPTGRLVRQFTLLLDPPATSTRAMPPISQPVLDERPRPKSSAGSAAAIATDIPAPDRNQAQSQAQARAQPESGPYRIPAAATTAGYPKRFGPVRPGVGLWQLARTNTPRGATVAQTAMALFRNNQDAFINGDVQRLSVGRTLTLPHAGELFVLSPEAAKREYDAALRGEEVQRTPLAAPPPVDESPDVGTPRLRIAAATGLTPIPAGTSQGPREGGTEAMEKELLLVRETSESAHQETVEMRGRIRDLEAQLAEIQQLLKLRNEELARAQGARGSVPVGAPGVLGVQPQPPRQLAVPGGASAGQGAVGTGPAPIVPEGQVGSVVSPAVGLPQQTQPDRVDQTTVPAPETKSPQVQAGGVGTPPVETQPKTPVLEESVGDSPWLALWLPLAGIVGVTALGIAALAWLRVRRRAARDLGLESAAVEPPEPPKQQPIPDHASGALGLGVLGGLRSRLRSHLRSWLRRGRASDLGVDFTEQSGEAMSTTTPKRDLADLLHTVRRWLSARLPAGAGAGPDSSSESGLESEPDHHLSEEVVTEVLPNATDAQARPDRGAAPAPEGEWEAKIPGVELLTLPRYRLPTEQSEVATVAEEPPPIDSVAPDQAELTIHTENAISKADVYMAYGRYREAEDLIREEIQRRPERMELKFKLAAIYEASGRLDSLRALMLEMQEAGVEQSNPQDWWYLVDRVQVATAAVEADHVPDNQEEPVIDNLDLELDLDLDLDRDESAPVDQLEPVSDSAQDRPPDEGLPDDTGVKLDLARVYLQIGDLESARDLLEEVVDEGTAVQWAEAQELLRGIV